MTSSITENSAPLSVFDKAPKVLFNKNFTVTAAQIQALSGSHYEVWASHTDPQHSMMAVAPYSFLEPKGLIGYDYCEWLLAEAVARGFAVLIAGKEREKLAEYKEQCDEKGIKLIVPASRPTQDLLENKDEFLRGWDETILPIPRWATFDTLADFDAAYVNLKTPRVRLCIKPARGIYASGFRVLLEQPDLQSFLAGELYQMTTTAARELFASGELPTMLLMQTLEGAERSIDCVALEGQLIRAVIRKKGTDGQVIESRPDLLEAAEKIAKKYQLSGIFNFQTKDQGGVPHMLEINARASGGLRYSMSAGINFPLLLLDAVTGRLDWDNLPIVQTGLTASEDKVVRVHG